jgi:trans-2-enoyl-CoA reductase
MRKVNAIMIHAHGPPAEVVRLEEQTIAAPEADEVIVQMQAAPINPVDLNVIEGKYPVLPELPAVPGVEGAGVIAAKGSAVSGFEPGTPVLLSARAGSWREACRVKAAQVRAVPPEIPIAQAAMLKINPATAWRMLHDFVKLKPGDWVLQNAANSGVGRSVIQISKAIGFRTVNVVRREELIAELLQAGADAVLLDRDDLPGEIQTATGGAPIALAFNAVGGESALRLANALAPGGTIITYGAMGRKPLRIPNGLLIFKDLRWRGFWVTQWYERASGAMRDEMFAELFRLARSGVLHSPIEREYGIRDARAAILHSQRSARSGKVIFRF